MFMYEADKSEFTNIFSIKLLMFAIWKLYEYLIEYVTCRLEELDCKNGFQINVNPNKFIGGFACVQANFSIYCFDK